MKLYVAFLRVVGHSETGKIHKWTQRPFSLLVLQCNMIYMYTQTQSKRNTWVFISFQYGTCKSKFCFNQTIVFYILYQKIILCIAWLAICIVLKYLFENKFLTSCNVPHKWFVFLHRALLADWVSNIFPTSKCWYCSPYQNIRRLNLKTTANNLRADGSGKL